MALCANSVSHGDDMDISLYSETHGSGEPLILLHGNGSSGEYFQHQAEAFAPFYQVITVDTRGHGRSPRGTAPFTMAQFAEDLEAFMTEKEIPKAHILGFSDGGNIALKFALRYPERVNRLILNSPNLDTDGVKPSIQKSIETGYRCVKFFAGFSRKAQLKSEIMRLMVDEPNISPTSLSALQMRTLVIAGTDDMILKEHTELIYQSLPNAELVFLPGDHCVARKNPELFNRTVLEFLKKP